MVVDSVVVDSVVEVVDDVVLGACVVSVTVVVESSPQPANNRIASNAARTPCLMPSTPSTLAESSENPVLPERRLTRH